MNQFRSFISKNIVLKYHFDDVQIEMESSNESFSIKLQSSSF